MLYLTAPCRRRDCGPPPVHWGQVWEWSLQRMLAVIGPQSGVSTGGPPGGGGLAKVSFTSWSSQGAFPGGQPLPPEPLLENLIQRCPSTAKTKCEFQPGGFVLFFFF